MKKILTIILCFLPFVFYCQSFDERNGTPTANIDEVNGTLTANIDEINGVQLSLPVPVYEGSGASKSSTTSSIVSLAYPSGIQQNDILIIQLGFDYSSSAPSAPTGWTRDYNGLGYTNCYIFSKRADGTETGTIDLTVGSNTYTKFAQMHRFSGCAASGTYIGSVSQQNYGSTTSWYSASYSDRGTSLPIVFFFVNYGTAGTLANDSWTQMQIVTTTTGSDYTLVSAYQNADNSNNVTYSIGTSKNGCAVRFVLLSQ